MGTRRRHPGWRFDERVRRLPEKSVEGPTRESAPLRAWVQPIATRRGKRVAAVAFARRLAEIFCALWRDGTEYQPHRAGRRHPVVTAAA